MSLIAEADRQFLEEQGSFSVCEAIQHGVPQEPFDYCAKRESVRLTRRESAYEVGDEQVTEYSHALLRGVRAVMSCMNAVCKYFSAVAKRCQETVPDGLDSCFEDVKKIYSVALSIHEFYTETEDVTKSEVGANTSL